MGLARRDRAGGIVPFGLDLVELGLFNFPEVG